MALINLKSDLTSCKYGHDRPGGSDSGQPFIISYSNGDIEVNTSARNPLALVGVSSIPAVPNFTTLLGRKKIGQFILDAVNGDDFIRGGGAGSLQASINDVFRIGTFLASLPKGPIFLGKQIGLQLSNPRLESRKGPTSFAGIGGFIGRITGGILEPTRTYNAGVNTLAQVGGNAFGTHFVRHGLSPIIRKDDPNKYEKIVINNNADDLNISTTSRNWRDVGNRLISLQTKFTLGYTSNFNFLDVTDRNRGVNISANAPTIDPTTGEIVSSAGLQGTFTKGKVKKEPNQDVIRDYWGGPESVYGIGWTRIRREYTSDDNFRIKELYSKSKEQAGKSRNSEGGPVAFYQSPLSLYGDGAPLDYVSPSGNIVKINTKKYLNFQQASREKRVGSGTQDKLNLVPIFQLSNKEAPTKGWINITGTGVVDINDLVNFQIRAIVGNNPSLNNWMVFRAYITQFSDNVDANWNGVKYAGRGENFYIYDGFSRKINIGFKVAALSAEEMKPMYQKLNYLMSNLMPEYTDDNILMNGPLVKMTVGNWINGQDGILNSLSYTVPQESPWEVNITTSGNEGDIGSMVLPHIVEVQMTFTPIGSQTNGLNALSRKPNVTLYNSHIAQAADAALDTPRYITGSILGGVLSRFGPIDNTTIIGSSLPSTPPSDEYLKWQEENLYVFGG